VELAADLDPRVQARVAFDFRFQNEVLESAFRENGVRAADGGRAGDGSVLDLVGRETATDLPAIERLTVEERDPAVVGRAGAQCEDEAGRERACQGEPDWRAHAKVSQGR